MSSKFSAYFKLVRPVNVLLGALSIFIGALVTGMLAPVTNVVLACISGALILAGGNAINDYFDLEIDRVNKPSRPLASGLIRPNATFMFSIILFAFGVFLSIFVNLLSCALAVVVATGLFFYSARLKRTVLLGNLAVSLFGALAFIYGALAVNHFAEALVPAGFAFLFHLGREILKDLEDQDGDRMHQALTLPVKFGPRVTLALATAVFSLLILLTFVPFALNLYGKAYLAIVVVGVDLVILGILVLMWMNPSPDSLRRISLVLKTDMFVGLLAILVGSQSQSLAP